MALRTTHWQKHVGYALRAVWLGLPCWALAQTQAAVEHHHEQHAAPQAGLHAAAPAASESAATTMKQPAALPTVAAASATVPSAMPTCFGEAQWLALQRSTAHPFGQGAADKVLLYVWSPRMVFSAVHAHEVQQEAQALGLRFVPVHDGRLPAEEVAQALAVLPQKLQKPQNLVPGSAAPQPHSHLHPHPLQTSVPLCAPSLVERDAYRHFPTAWVVQHGSFHPVPLVSAMPPRFWRMGLLERLQPQPKLQRSQSAPDAAR